MRIVLLLVLAATSLLAQWGDHHTADHNVVVSRYTNHDFGFIGQFIPPAPVKLDGAYVFVRTAQQETPCDAFLVTLRYRQNGKLLQRSQVVTRWSDLDATGREVYSAGLFLIGPNVEVVSVTVDNLVWSSEEIEE